MRAIVAWLAVLALAPVAHADVLVCPAGTKQQQLESAELGKRAEFCVDEKTGVEQGPGRTYDLNGQLLSEFTHQAGEKTPVRVTLAGARDLLVTLNGSLEMMRMPAKMHEVDERTLRFDIQVEPPEGDETDVKTMKETIEQDLGSDPYTCLLLRLPRGPYELVNVRYLRADGSPWLELRVTREHCGQSN
jgi:hypothetical protein